MQGSCIEKVAALFHEGGQGEVTSQHGVKATKEGKVEKAT